MNLMEVSSFLRWPREPYPGLRPFHVGPDSDETLIFYGRNSHKEEIIKRLQRQQFVFVTGPSGCGKSSLVRAGVLPALQAGLLGDAGSDWRMVTMRPGLAPVQELATVLSKLCSESVERLHTLLSRELSGLWMVAEMINERNAGVQAPVLLLVDQFEEIFAPNVPRDQADQFIRLIVRFFERPHAGVYLIVTMRTDFLEACTKFAGLASVINATQFLTPILGLQDLVQAISRPAEDYGGVVGKPLLDRLLIDMRPGAGYDPDNLALLQHSLQWLWRRACIRHGLTEPPKPMDDSGPLLELDLQSYLDAGGLRGILNVHADEVAGCYQGEDRAVLEAIFTRIAEKTLGGGYRRSPATVSDIAGVSGSPERVWKIVNELSSEDVGFLEIRTAANHDEAVVDICHEALIRTWNQYRAWVDQEADKLRLVRRVADDAVRWQQRGRRDEDLQQGSVLQFLVNRWKELRPTKEWASRYPLSPSRSELLSNIIPLIEDFFAESQRLYEREQSRLKQLELKAATTRIRLARDRLVGLAVLFAIIGSFLGYRSVTGDRQVNELEAASFRVLAEDALTTRNDAPTALLWVLEGIKRLPSFQSVFEPLLYRSLQNLRLRKLTRFASNVTSVSFSPDTKFVVSAHQDGKIRISSIESGQIAEMAISEQETVGAVFARARWSPNGQLIAIAGRDAVTLLSPCSIASLQGTGACKNTDSNAPREPVAIPVTGVLTTALFSPDSKTLLVQAGATFFQSTTTSLFDLASLREPGNSAQQPFKTIPNTTWAAAFNSDGDDLAVGRQDGRIHLLQGPKFSQEKLLGDEAGRVSQSLAFNGGSELELYSGHIDGNILKWDLHTGKPTNFKKQEGQVFQLSISKDGEWLAGSSDAGFVTIWATHQPQQRAVQLGPHGGPVWNFDLGGSGVNNWVVAGSRTSMYLWTRRSALAPQIELSVATDRAASSLPVRTDSENYSIDVQGETVRLRRPEGAEPASWAARTPAGDYFAVAQDGGPVLLYSKPEDYPIAALEARPRNWKAVTFDRDRIVAYSESGDRVSWPFLPAREALVDFANSHIPVVDGQPMRLNPDLLCLLIQTRKSNHSDCPRSNEQNSAPGRQTGAAQNRP
jgi:WD40 repeat protein/energy-coupling factor transporter ATP-binding protein EcfA2